MRAGRWAAASPAKHSVLSAHPPPGGTAVTGLAVAGTRSPLSGRLCARLGSDGAHIPSEAHLLTLPSWITEV